MISETVLVAAEPFGKRLDGAQVAEAIGCGMRASAPTLQVDRCPLDGLPGDFDVRMRRARAVVLAAACLDHRTLLARGAIFEIATRARQSGVPCYGVAKHVEIDLFEARILDLQVMLQASDSQQLVAAGETLAEMV